MPSDFVCHMYLHDKVQGTQVMIVSHPSKKYIAVVFAGTDDARTFLADGDVLMKSFEPIPGTYVHRGIENSLFEHHLDKVLLEAVADVQKNNPGYSLFTTGHSLGAADAILLSATMVSRGYLKVTTITFGCPRIGNHAFVEALSALEPNLQIWRIVLGYDLIPRLPQYPFHHVGHTIQWQDSERAKVYYHHVGNSTLGYVGVPKEWDAEPFVWVPKALELHRMENYLKYIQNTSNDLLYVDHFEPINGNNIDDDDYFNPTDDIILLSEDEKIISQQ